MKKKVLITGGAGFIGSHVADELLRRGCAVRALDNLAEQVHGPNAQRPKHLAKDVELVVGDVRDERACQRALAGVDEVVHLAARVGVGQSMYQVADYVDVNSRGTACLLEAIAKRPVKKLVVASSMSVYGEGLYADANGTTVGAATRASTHLRAGAWEPQLDGQPLRPVPTPENKAIDIASVYALSKFDQERLCLTVGRAYGVPTVALRFFNVYGPRQALCNPYTGVLAIFSARLLCGKPPLVNEDGLQRRDFVSVHDVVQACVRALESTTVSDDVFNIGSGRSYTVLDIARRVALAVGRPDIQPEITQSFRTGDIRHCFADISKARTHLGYAPTVDLDDGLRELAGWLGEGHKVDDRIEDARQELSVRGLAS